MSFTQDEQIDNLKEAIQALESQRNILGEAVVEDAISALKKQLADLQEIKPPLEQQRRLVTVLFTDVVGSTRLGRHLEPDEFLEIMDKAL